MFWLLTDATTLTRSSGDRLVSYHRASIGMTIFIGLMIAILKPAMAEASPPSDELSLKFKDSDVSKEEKPWHLDLEVRSLHPRLSDTKSMLDDRLKAPLKLDWAHTFDRPYTPIDRNTDWGFGSVSIGVGRQENDWLIWTVRGGGGWGDDRNFDRSLFNTLEVNFKYRYAHVGGDLEIYPWKVPQPLPHARFADMICASRPFVFTGLETGYVSSEGEGSFRMLRVPFYRDSAHIRDWTTSVRLGLGWSFPLSTSFSLQLTGDYACNFYRPDEYNGWQLIAGLRYRF